MDKNSSQDNKPSILQEIYFRVYLQESWLGKDKEAKKYLEKVFEISSSAIINFDEWIIDLSSKEKEGRYVEYAKRALGNFPKDDDQKRPAFKKIYGKLFLAQAFHEFELNNRWNVIKNIFSGFMLVPKDIKNFGIIVIFFKSLIGIKSNHFMSKNQSSLLKQIPSDIISQIESVLNTKINNIESLKLSFPSDSVFLISTQNKDEYIFRTFDHKKNILDFQKKIYSLLSKNHVKIPNIVYSDSYSSHNMESFDWLIEEKLMGEWFYPDKWDIETHQHALTNLAKYLQNLHQISASGFGYLQPCDYQTQFDTFERWLYNTQKDILNGFLSGAIPTSMAEMITQAANFLKNNFKENPALCHGDLQPRNILFHNNVINAIVDWEAVSGNDAAYDFAYFLLAMGRYYPSLNHDFVQLFLEAYGKKDDLPFQKRIIAYQVLIIAKKFIWAAEQTDSLFPEETDADLKIKLENIYMQGKYHGVLE